MDLNQHGDRSVRAPYQARASYRAVARAGHEAALPRRLFVVFTALLLLAVMLGSRIAEARGAPDSFADLAEKLSPAVVNISTTQTVTGGGDEEGEVPMPQFPPGSPFEEFFKDFLERQGRGNAEPRKVTSLGSGFVIDPSGVIVTNNHVIQDAEEITVTLSDGTKLPAELRGKDPKTDVAVLVVKPSKPLPFVNFGDSDKARVGDWVLAIGNPFGLGGSVSAGIISARNRDINAGPYDDFIQTDAAINRGNSGGPLFNMDGEVIGINTAIYSPSGGSVGIGFSVPSALARQVVAQLREFGETRRGWLGVRIQTVTDEIAESLTLDKARGALVAGVDEKGPAAEAGIQAGDVILTFDGKPVTDMRSLPRVVAETRIGATVPVTVWRDGKEKGLQVKVGQLDEKVADASANSGNRGGSNPGRVQVVLGMSLSPVTADLRTRHSIPEDVKGVVVTEVAGSSFAAEKGVRPGDVILEVAQSKVESPAQIADKVKAEKEAGKKSVLFLISRAGDLSFVALRVDK
ncbi:DegQ family serine endoprotease [Zavarzinia compransoris]|uniref:Probable periplasmic serine endoprotease DegP-like n=1 Tax=Zavarzinia compransoris TaxID=1264899 RepID=A0A317E5Q7_9PROT|nr:DegQ family serine endoprotease [Zavarzinia compransoris]PWR22359.1 serine protease [Zavarzinia compransoris]TDP46873.1 serine protease Do [Zavarzinia compransoris]